MPARNLVGEAVALEKGPPVRGAKKGRPTSAAVAGAIQSANCRVPDLQPAIEALRAEQEEISDTLREMRRDANSTREMVVRIEERTRG